MRALIIDDEKHCIESLSILLEKACPQVSVIESCLNGQCGLESIKSINLTSFFLTYPCRK